MTSGTTGRSSVLDALRYLARACDGATSRDGEGFSSNDAAFGRDLAAKGAQWGLTARQHAAGQKLAHRYRRQLTAAGFDAAALAAEAHAPPAVAASTAASLPDARPTPNGVGMAMPNRYAGRCEVCGIAVTPGMGTADKVASRLSGRWAVYCFDHPPASPGGTAYNGTVEAPATCAKR